MLVKEVEEDDIEELKQDASNDVTNIRYGRSYRTRCLGTSINLGKFRGSLGVFETSGYENSRGCRAWSGEQT